MKARGSPAPRWLPFSISRSLEVLAVVALLLIAGGTTHRLLASRALIMSDTERQMSRLDMVFAEQTGRAVETIDLVLLSAIRTLQERRASRSAPTVDFEQKLARRIAGVRQVSEIAITDAHGAVLHSSRGGAPNPLMPAARALIAAQAASPHPNPGLQFSKPFRDPSGKWTALMFRPILRSDGKYEGAALAFINLSYFEDFYRAVELTEAGAILLHLRDGTVLARYPILMPSSGKAMPSLPPFKDILAHRMAGTVVMDSPIDGTRRVLAIRALKAFPLAVNVSVAQDRVLAFWRRQVWTFSLIGFGASVVIVSLLLALARRSRRDRRVAGRIPSCQGKRRGGTASLGRANG